FARVTGQVADNFTASKRMGDQCHFVQVKGFDYSSKVVGEEIEIITAPRIAGAPMSAPVVGNTAEALLRQWVHLVGPHLRRERPPRQEEQWLAAAPIAVEQADAVNGLDVAGLPDQGRSGRFGDGVEHGLRSFCRDKRDLGREDQAPAGTLSRKPVTDFNRPPSVTTKSVPLIMSA